MGIRLQPTMGRSKHRGICMRTDWSISSIILLTRQAKMLFEQQ